MTSEDLGEARWTGRLDPTEPGGAGGRVTSTWAAHRYHLETLGRRGRLRSLGISAGIDFTSNDYLGLAASDRLRDAVGRAIAAGVPLGSGGSRLLGGNHDEHVALEEEAALLFGSESVLFFSSGYAANSTLLGTLPQEGDLIVHDALVHASAHEGMRLARAPAVGAGHNNPQAVEDAIIRWRKRGGGGRAWIVVESLYSMDGDIAPLDELMEVAKRHDAFLLIDEAHATGVFGSRGIGLAEGLDGSENVITLRTCGKALGCEGALVCAPAIVRDFLVNRGRQFIFSTAPSPLIASAVREALRIIKEEPERRAALRSLIKDARQALAPLGVEVPGSQITPVVLGSESRAIDVARSLQVEGFDVRAIRPPTVPQGSSRIRVSLSLNVTRDDIRSLASALGSRL